MNLISGDLDATLPDSRVSDLDATQRSAALATGNCLVLAGPGSGKTRLLTAKAQYILDQSPNGQLAAVSFTRSSAKELITRIGKEHKSRLLAGTFHSLALQQNPNRKRILDEAGRVHYVKIALKRSGVDLQVGEAIQAIDKFKATLAPPPVNGEEAQVFRFYENELAGHGLRDFQDILLSAVKGIKAGAIKPLPAKWLLVDEAQDMDEVQYEWVMAHVRAGIITTLVADDDQSIYGWRHALGYQGLTRFEREAKAKRLHLESNYRCGYDIVKAGSSVIKNNAHRYKKRIVPARDKPGKVLVRSYKTPKDEAYAIAELLKTNSAQWGVLARTNRRLDDIQLACSLYGIRFLRLGGKSFWGRAPAAAILAFFEDLVKQDLRTGMSRISTFADGATQADLAAIHEGKKPEKHRGLIELIKLSPEWMKTAREVDRANLTVKAVSMWAEKYLHQRPMRIIKPALDHIGKRTGSLAQRLAQIRNAEKKPLPDTQQDLPVFSSLHSSKGMEWDNVWLVGCEDGVIPHVDSSIEEERRLFYVGLTRAKDQVITSYSLEDSVPSRFIAEI